MKGIELPSAKEQDIDPVSSDHVFQNISSERRQESAILASFTPDQVKEIRKKQRSLSSLAYFIGKDFEIPVLLNAPGAGWHWNFKENYIKIDSQDLLEKPIEYLRFVISHEGGHRRVSRTEFIPEEVWKQPGFSFLMNAIEDPRMNNFVAESYPAFRPQMELAYNLDLDIEKQSKTEATKKLGHEPRFVKAGFEYIKQWFLEVQNKEGKLSEDLPREVKEAVKKTLSSARDSWWMYPSREEADKSEAKITEYAKASYEVNLHEIWPEFQKLIEQDKKDQEIEEWLKDKMAQGKEEAGEKEESSRSGNLPKELSDQLTPDETKALEEAIEKAIEDAQIGKGGKEGKPEQKDGEGSGDVIINLDTLPDSLKEKIKKYIDSLPESEKKELEEKATQALKDFEDKISQELEGKLSENPEEREKRLQGEEKTEKGNPETKAEEESIEDRKDKRKREEKAKEDLRDSLRKIFEKDQTEYDRVLREVAPIINQLESELRNIFRERKARGFEAGKKSGPKISIRERIKEVAQDVPAFKSRAWQRRDRPTEKDYAITLLIDLSGSMRQGGKIEEAFKGVIILAEVLNRLSIKTEILGFNDRLHEFQAFSKSLSEEVRGKMGTMLQEVETSRAKYNDDGWAVEEASKRLDQQEVDEKFLMVLSDGVPEPSSQHSGDEYDLKKVVQSITKKGKQKLIGLGLGNGASHVKKFYPKNIANISVEELPEQLAGLLKQIIEHYDEF